MSLRDDEYMGLALLEGRKALPACLPNPPVGCVLVRNDRIIASGYTQAPYRPHAEAAALASLGEAGSAAGVTAYVTLEPCSFHGRTPACAQALIDAGVKRVVVGMLDPDGRNNGRGVQLLRSAGVEVTVGVLGEEVARALSPYLALPENQAPRRSAGAACSAQGPGLPAKHVC